MSRGMKQFLPYRSLPEQEGELTRLFYDYHKQEKPLLSPDQVEEINRFLQEYRGETVSLTYFDDGYIYQVETKIKSLDLIGRKLVLPNMTIDFTDLLEIKTPQ